MFFKLKSLVRSNLITLVIKLKWQKIVLLGLAFLLLLQTLLMAGLLAKTPLAPPDTSSPQATLRSFVENISRAHQILMESYEQYQQESKSFPSTSVGEKVQQGRSFLQRAIGTLNLSEIPSSLKQDTGIESTVRLLEILERIEIPPYTEIPDAEAVANEELSRWTLPDTEIHIVKVEQGPRAGEFLFSPETVDRLPEFYQKIKNLPYKPDAIKDIYQIYISTPGEVFLFKLLWYNRVPSWLNAVYWGLALWQWIGLVISLAITFLICYQSFHWQWRRASLSFSSSQATWESLLYFSIITAVSLVTSGYFIDHWLNVSGNVRLIVLTTLEIIFWIIIALGIVIFSNFVAEKIIDYPGINSQDIDASAIRIVSRVLGVTISITVLILGIERVGISLIPILAGLGIGGLALALAGKTTIENFIGGLVLFIDRPVRVGDFCLFGEEQRGVVENIGLRSTRIRGLDRTLTSVPNADFSQMQLVNYAVRDRILLNTTFGLRYETTYQQMKLVLSQLQEMLLTHPKLIEEQARVRFIKYGDYAKEVEIFVYADTRDWSEFLGIQEDVLLRVQEIIEYIGTDFGWQETSSSWKIMKDDIRTKTRVTKSKNKDEKIDS